MLRRSLAYVLLVVAGLAAMLWWVVGIVAYWRNFPLPFQLAGFFILPNLLLPFVSSSHHGKDLLLFGNMTWHFVWWSWYLFTFGPAILYAVVAPDDMQFEPGGTPPSALVSSESDDWTSYVLDDGDEDEDDSDPEELRRSLAHETAVYHSKEAKRARSREARRRHHELHPDVGEENS